MVEYNQFLNALKGQFNTLNLILLLLVITLILHIKNKRLASRILAIFTSICFVVFSTGYLPQYIVGRIESRYKPFNGAAYLHVDDQVFIQVLGGGYVSDVRLPSATKLSHTSLGRLAEGLRICHLLDKGVLVVSGNVASGDESMAAVARSAAIGMGLDSARIEALESPGTTKAEAIELVRNFGEDINLILVTDAIHMPRAIRFFREQGVDAYPAPTNFLIRKDDNPFALRWIPSVENLLLMDRVWRELLGSLKGAIQQLSPAYYLCP